MAPGDTTGSYHRAVYSHIFIEYLILYGPVQRQRPSHGTTHTGAVFTRLGILLPQDPSITHSHPSIPLSLPLGCTASRNIITSLTRFPCFLGSLLLLLFPCCSRYSSWFPVTLSGLHSNFQSIHSDLECLLQWSMNPTLYLTTSLYSWNMHSRHRHCYYRYSPRYLSVQYRVAVPVDIPCARLRLPSIPLAFPSLDTLPLLSSYYYTILFNR